MKRVFQLLCAAVAVFLFVRLDMMDGLWERNIGADLAPGNEVVMYSLTTCGYCTAKRDRLRRAGIPFTEHFMDTHPAQGQELMEILRASNVPPGGIGTPTFTVNGVLLVNNPSLETIKKHLKYRASSS